MSGGIYKGPNGELLHGDGKPVGSPPLSPSPSEGNTTLHGYSAEQQAADAWFLGRPLMDSNASTPAERLRLYHVYKTSSQASLPAGADSKTLPEEPSEAAVALVAKRLLMGSVVSGLQGLSIEARDLLREVYAIDRSAPAAGGSPEPEKVLAVLADAMRTMLGADGVRDLAAKLDPNRPLEDFLKVLRGSKAAGGSPEASGMKLPEVQPQDLAFSDLGVAVGHYVRAIRDSTKWGIELSEENCARIGMEVARWLLIFGGRSVVQASLLATETTPQPITLGQPSVPFLSRRVLNPQWLAAHWYNMLHCSCACGESCIGGFEWAEHVVSLLQGEHGTSPSKEHQG